MKRLAFRLLTALFAAALLVSPSTADSTTVLDFEDLEATGADYHLMTEHNPYHGVTFNFEEGYPGHTLAHWDASWYAIPHSGAVYLFNAYGQDSMSIEFASPVNFQGAWVGCPKADASKPPDFWFEGYLGATKVGESPVITLGSTMQWLQADFSGPVDAVVLRRNPYIEVSGVEHKWYTIDDITFDEPNTVTIDIKPGDSPNSINLRSKGVTPVAVLTTDDFDASTIDPATVTLEGVAPVKWSLTDVPELSGEGSGEYAGDGDIDLMLHFSTPELAEVLSKESTEATLTGQTYEGADFEGTDSVKIPKGSK